ncbi:Detected protein of unknown function [Hibiscus syriacus]|uniref:RING-type domain-containing protein n=1 Tax=Hibiscus syriacus TaxID=106335 RepID=A0A6A3D0X1_HIBSY|nr:probable E3 ubiquitin-protein ligase RHA1A [Hibiscus syriacus]KAE8735373.1 Detected protein of unknown function [Hibiscus syriacus]
MAAGSTKCHFVVSGNETVLVPLDRRCFDLDAAMMMPQNPEATARTAIRLVSDMPTVDYATGNCSICMENLWPSDGSSASRRLSCGHVYHHDCITDWLLNANSYSCPLCRRQISL